MWWTEFIYVFYLLKRKRNLYTTGLDIFDELLPVLPP